MATAIAKNFNLGDTIYFVIGTDLYSGLVDRITTNTIQSGTTVLYYLTDNITVVNETLAFATAQLAVNDFAARILEAFEA